MSTFKGKTTSDTISLTTEEIRKAINSQKKFNCTLNCAYRSVIRHWPNEHAWEDELNAKMNQPCVMAFCIPLEQKAYISEILTNFYPPQGSFPFFASKYHIVDSGDREHHTWEQVKEIFNTRQVHWIFVPFPRTITRSAANYEFLYQHIVVKEGIREIVGFSAALDDFLPLLDYFSARNAGARATDLALGLPAGGLDTMRDWPPSLREVMGDGGVRDPSPLALPAGLNLFGNDPATAVRLRKNKASVQEALRAQGLAHIPGLEAWSAREAMALGVLFPVVVKPACGAGSAFVTLCHNEQELEDAFGVWEAQWGSGPPPHALWSSRSSSTARSTS
ncbi:unnamed protein product [Phytomonas sp. Hart1]|nr:unnamed protein product [Phytomonas sp. Hart1]|eukprot:CCW68702.1 unnamed protein product [Phytomonas sp. isolate Hart1]